MFNIENLNYTRKIILWLDYNWNYIIDAEYSFCTEPHEIIGNTLIINVLYTALILVKNNLGKITQNVNIFMCQDMKIEIRAKVQLAKTI